MGAAPGRQRWTGTPRVRPARRTRTDRARTQHRRSRRGTEAGLAGGNWRSRVLGEAGKGSRDTPGSPFLSVIRPQKCARSSGRGARSHQACDRSWRMEAARTFGSCPSSTSTTTWRYSLVVEVEGEAAVWVVKVVEDGAIARDERARRLDARQVRANADAAEPCLRHRVGGDGRDVRIRQVEGAVQREDLVTEAQGDREFVVSDLDMGHGCTSSVSLPVGSACWVQFPFRGTHRHRASADQKTMTRRPRTPPAPRTRWASPKRNCAGRASRLPRNRLGSALLHGDGA